MFEFLKTFTRSRPLAIFSGVLLIMLLGLAGVSMFIDFSDSEKLDDFFAKKYAKSQYPGFAVAVIKDGKIAYEKNFGYANIRKGKCATGKTLYQIASVSKLVTASALMTLYDKGFFDLDDPINDFLPFEINHPRFPDKRITFRMLLTHAAGILDDSETYMGTYLHDQGGGDSVMSIEEYIVACYTSGGKWYSSGKMFSEEAPGASYKYANGGFAVLSYLIERMSGEPFNVYCRKAILLPLEMTSSGWLLSEVDRSELALPYTDGLPLPYYGYPTYPDGSLKTTIRDFSNFMIMFMNGGDFKGKTVLKKETVDLMLTKQIEKPAHGLAWSLDLTNDGMSFLEDTVHCGHGGNDPGIFTIVAYFPEQRTAFLFFSNTDLVFNIRFMNIAQVLAKLTELCR